MDNSNNLTIEIVFCENDLEILKTIKLKNGSNVEDAIKISEIMAEFPNVLVNKQIGIWGKKADLKALLKNKDRIEIYRPLIIDPKKARLLRAKSESN
ncbi:MAG: hypothetical protein JWM09_1267 [Francisellaceae bacterium]|nr:hypothetical protein [Francisellaceae bacterium]